jgi:8-oxo-dGTP pyrophosphatase MutT (NUDIX family)
MATLARKLSSREPDSGLSLQAAAICYRWRGGSLEFLLVNTSSGKWTFPKGRIEPSLSASESAACEAWEEAGAKGRIEREHFAVYLDTKRIAGHDNQSREIMIAGFLFEVHSTVDPEENHRNPTWFAPDQAKTRLQEARISRYARQVSSVIDAAMERLRHKHMLHAPAVTSSAKRARMGHAR